MVKICNKTYSDDKTHQPHFDVFDFPLSDFQKYAIEAIVTGNHTLVTAHTGSGKTLPAEFALQYFVQQKKKVIYTSPIKALSNQKYYEFTKKYPHISFGLLTGDIKINPTADVLIMTAEILMNYLFVSNKDEPEKVKTLQFQMDIANELACVVMDEVHYINDQDRGQVWEKTILLLPPTVQMVMLSATIDSPEKFAEWCENAHPDSEKEVFLASTNHRVVPLTHYSFLTTNEAAFKKIKDKTIQSQIRASTNHFIPLQSSDGTFQIDGYSKTRHLLKNIFEPNQLTVKRTHVLNTLSAHLKNEDMLPAIAFVFSRKNVEVYAKEVTTVLLEDDSKIPYTVRRECEQILRKLPNFQEYLQLPEYNELVSLLEKGIGIHHSGMIPILREIVELMISKKYIKLLFATESFAIGLDCPIRTAIFTSLTKFDGTYERFLMAHEYTQMAGRAGRRGIDTVGHVVHCNNLFDVPSQTDYKTILGGKPQTLISKFRINYPLILNLIKNGKTDNFHTFVEKSMISGEIMSQKKHQEMVICELISSIEISEKGINSIRTPHESCCEYLRLINVLPTLVNKKRKEAERSIQSLKDNHKYIVDDSVKVSRINAFKDKLIVQQQYLESMNRYVKDKVDKICDILCLEQFITKEMNDENRTQYRLSEPLGNYAAGIAEINSIIFAKMMHNTRNFADFSVKQLIALFSCFTEIKIPNDKRINLPKSDDKILLSHIKTMHEMFIHHENLEIEHQVDTGTEYINPLMCDIVDDVNKWCDCENEAECKYFIYSVLKEKEISIGDFTKSMLKISTISKEVMSLCEQYNIIDLMHKMSQIDHMILKYITTTQSLYI